MTSSSLPVHQLDREERYFRAVVECDGSFDGEFFYSVLTTGVFCKPSCRSRRPRRENVRFHLTAEEAKRAGYRPCKRCQPEEAVLHGKNSVQVTALCRLMEGSEGSPSMESMARRVGVSPSHAHRTFKDETGVTPGNYLAALRRQKIQKDLPVAESVTEAIYSAGYGSPARFYAASRSVLGMNARAYRNRGEGETIRFALAACSLGALLVAASELGVCAILLGDEPSELVEDLARRFSKANLEAGVCDFDEWVAVVVGLVDQPSCKVDLPLDIRGTVFQQRVWEALRRIPPGKTMTYSEVARELGDPKAARAVASACAKNPLAVAVPCHRVVRRGGALSGYRWGVERKRQLLERESSR